MNKRKTKKTVKPLKQKQISENISREVVDSIHKSNDSKTPKQNLSSDKPILDDPIKTHKPNVVEATPEPEEPKQSKFGSWFKEIQFFKHLKEVILPLVSLIIAVVALCTAGNTDKLTDVALNLSSANAGPLITNIEISPPSSYNDETTITISLEDLTLQGFEIDHINFGEITTIAIFDETSKKISSLEMQSDIERYNRDQYIPNDSERVIESSKEITLVLNGDNKTDDLITAIDENLKKEAFSQATIARPYYYLEIFYSHKDASTGVQRYIAVSSGAKHHLAKLNDKEFAEFTSTLIDEYSEEYSEAYIEGIAKNIVTRLTNPENFIDWDKQFEGDSKIDNLKYDYYYSKYYIEFFRKN